MERVELIEDLDVRGFRAQGTVDAGGRIPMFTAWCPAVDCRRIIYDGSALRIISSCQ